MRLIIVGNGFDLHHGLKTSFKDYCGFLKEQYENVLGYIINFRYFNGCCRDLSDDSDVFWTDVEGNLSFDYEQMFEESIAAYDSDFMEKDESNDYRGYESVENYPHEVRSMLPTNDIDDVDTSFTSDSLQNWVHLIPIDNVEQDPKMFLYDSDCFISFNYTRTLEVAYHIEPSKVLHIHGCVGKSLQFGNPIQTPAKIRALLEQRFQNDIRLERIKDAFEKIQSFALKMSKDIDENIPNLCSFLEKKKEKITEVVIMGHSYLKGDKKYYEKILIPDYDSKKWTIYCHTKEEVIEADAFFKEYKIQGCTIVW